MRKQLTREEKRRRLKIRIIGSIAGMIVIAAAIVAYQYYVEHSEWLEHIPLLPAEMQSITEVTCEKGGETTSFTYDGSAWSAPEGEEIAEALQNLTAIYIVVKPGEPAEYGLDDASAAAVTARDSAGHSATVLLGDRHGNNSYARLAGGGDIYLVSPALANALG